MRIPKKLKTTPTNQPVRKVTITTCLFLLALSGYSQLTLYPVERAPQKKGTPAARTQSTDPVSLPFWDDFSTVRTGYADPLRWEHSNSAWINAGMAINPPSINVATLDGLDSLGKPYSVNDVLAKGYADKMTSAPILMDDVAAIDRTRVFISFFYQFHGNGEPPDEGDLIELYFLDNAGAWNLIWSKENDGTLVKDKFEQVTIPITDAKYFHEGFRFRIQNFARLSGPYDTWHVDYFYVSNGKPMDNDPVQELFPDRTISTPLTPLFNEYTHMPIKHFFKDPASNLSSPSLVVTNLRKDQVPSPSQPLAGQPVSYSSEVTLRTITGEDPEVISTQVLDVDKDVTDPLVYNQWQTVALNTLPDPALLDEDADSITLQLNVLFDMGDNQVKTPSAGDYDFPVFNPIEFRTNDSVSTFYSLSNVYGYDDGSAEYAAGLNLPGAQVAYQFDMKTDEPDHVIGFDIYFPRFGDETTQLVQFQIWRELSNSAADIVYSLNVPIQRRGQNKFWRVMIVDEPPAVLDRFYIGWKQLSSATIAVGLDKNTDSSDKIFVNLNGTWVQNTTLKGSLMIRPIMGEGEDVISGIDDEVVSIHAFPNPSTGTFYLSSVVEQVELIDMTGRKASISTEQENDRTRVTLLSPAAGIYLLRTFQQHQWVVQKVLVKE